MKWIDVKKELPKESKAVLGFCHSENDSMEWQGLIQVHFCPHTGWNRTELYDPKPVHVLFWCEMPEKPEV